MKIAVISGKGGSGKSSISAALVSLSPKVVAVDCDVDASNLPLLFPHATLYQEAFVSGTEVAVDAGRCVGCGICVEHCAFGALTLGAEEGVEANELLCEGCGLCVRLCPRQALKMVPEARSTVYTGRFANGMMVYGNLCPGDDNSGKMIARLRCLADQLMETEHIRLQLLDGPPGIGCPVLSTVTGVDRVVIVCEPTVSGWADLLRAYQVASSFCTDIRFIINKCDLNQNVVAQIRRLAEERRLPVVAELPFDRLWVEAQVHCESIITYAPECQGARILAAAYPAICE